MKDGPEAGKARSDHRNPAKSALPRRSFLKAGATLATSSVLTAGGGAAAAPGGPWARRGGRQPEVAVVGAGAFGAWTALELQQRGARVTLIDQYGPANSRATSGGETRGVRTGYGNHAYADIWIPWAKRSIEKWREWDAKWQEMLLPRVFFTTGDLILRDEWDDFLDNTKKYWDELGIAHEVLEPEEIARRWPVIDLSGIAVGLFERDAGVARARRAIESVARVFEGAGGVVRIARAQLGEASGREMNELVLDPGDSISAEIFVFALGPWYPKAFPDIFAEKMRIPMGHVLYLSPPPGNLAYSFPNLPSYNFPGVTGWPALPPDNRGFRVRASGAAPDDPDTSRRWLTEEEMTRPLEFAAERFPGLANAPVSETRACHYEVSSSRNFFFDRHPDYDNVWLAGGGNAEGFKFGPVIGEYLAGRILGDEADSELEEAFRLP